MMAINVDKRLCVNGHLVPVKLDTLSFVDPYKLAEEEPEGGPASDPGGSSGQQESCVV